MLVEFGKTTGEATRGHLMHRSEGRPKLSKSQLPCKQPFTARCRTFLQGVGVLTATKGRGETYIVLQISSSRYMPTGKYLMIKVTTRYFSTWFDPSRTLTNSKGSTTQRHRQDGNLTILDRVPILIRSRSRIQWAGFSREGHGTQMQNMHGHSKPQVFPGGHMAPAQP